VQEVEKELLEALKDSLKNLDNDTLKFLYDKYLQRFIHDNSQIWKNLSFMIFFNLVSILGVYFGYIQSSSNIFFVKIAIGIFSILVGIVWLINAEVHRSFQNRHVLYLKAIEEVLVDKKLEIPHKIYDDKINELLSGKLRLVWVIRIFVFIYIFIWTFLIFIWTFLMIR